MPPKKQSKAQAKAAGQRPRRSRRKAGGAVAQLPARMRSVLDQHARNYLQMMADPCNAPLVPGVFPGVGSGMIYRLRRVLSAAEIGASAVDALVMFQPSNHLGNSGAGYWPIQFGSVNTSGTNIATRYAAQFGGFPTGSVRARCLAACIKLHYLGSELNRSGKVGHHLTNAPPFVDGASGGNPGITCKVTEMQTTANLTARLGDMPHEVRWVPDFENQDFVLTDNTSSAYGTAGNVCAISVVGAPAGSLSFEITAVYEVMPDATLGVVNPEQPPPSSNTLNDVLRTIGNVARFATDPSFVSRAVGYVKSAYGMYSQVAANLAPAVAALTL